MPTTNTPPGLALALLRLILWRSQSSAAGTGSMGRKKVSMVRSENSSLPTASNKAGASANPNWLAKSS